MNTELFLGDEVQILLFGAGSPFATSKADFISCKGSRRMGSGSLQYFNFSEMLKLNFLMY